MNDTEQKSDMLDETEIDLEELLAARRQIAVVWCIADVQEQRPDLSDDQAWDVLQEARRNHDAEMGISFSSLMWTASDLFGSAPDEVDED